MRMRRALAVSAMLASLTSSAWADATYECSQLDLQGTRLRVNPSVQEPFSQFHRATAGYRFTVGEAGSIAIWDAMPGGKWKVRGSPSDNITQSQIDPASGTVLVTDSSEGQLSIYMLETRGAEIAVLGTTIQRLTGQIGTSSIVMTMKGLCKRL